MNIFFLDKDPKVIPSLMSDRHISKMTVEAAQILSTTMRVLDGEKKEVIRKGKRKTLYIHPTLDYILYKPFGVNHPCSLWARGSAYHFLWLYDHFCALAEEYEKRYKKEHLSKKKLINFLSVPENLPFAIPYDPPLVMPYAYRSSDYVKSYRHYYAKEKLFSQKDKERFFGLLG